jgi:hypothetical protein
MDRHGKLDPDKPYLYFRTPSVRRGDRAKLAVYCPSQYSRTQVWLRRLGLRTGGPVAFPVFNVSHTVPAGCGQDFGWPLNDIDTTPLDPGVYIASTSKNPDATNWHSNALLVVRPTTSDPAAALYKLPLFTYQAYNRAGGCSFYVDCSNTLPGKPCPARGDSPKVSLWRPGGGLGGYTEGPDNGTTDPYSPKSLRGTFLHWDLPMIQWLEMFKSDIPIEFCTDLDLHSDPNLLSGRKLMISAGHDEYWTQEMRNQTSTFLQGGGNVAWFSGNTCWWKMTCDMGTTNGLLTRVKNWSQLTPPDPEESLIGVSYRFGAGKWNGTRRALRYEIKKQHPIFDGTGLVVGDVFGPRGAWDVPLLIGYECDGLYDQSGTKSTSSHLTVLAEVQIPADDGWDDFPSRTAKPYATMGCDVSRTGTVFNAATTDWPIVLGAIVADGREPVPNDRARGTVHIVTKNVLSTMAAGAVPSTWRV